MKRKLIQTVWRRVPAPNVAPIADRAEFFKTHFPVDPDFRGTFVADYSTVPGGFVPNISVAEEQEIEREYLTVGELREAIKDLPDDAPVAILNHEYDEYDDARAVEQTDGKAQIR